MRYVEARIDEYNREEAYRIYISKCLQLVPQQKYMNMAYTDMIKSMYEKPETRTGDEIVTDIMKRAGLKFEE